MYSLPNCKTSLDSICRCYIGREVAVVPFTPSHDDWNNKLTSAQLIFGNYDFFFNYRYQHVAIFSVKNIYVIISYLKRFVGIHTMYKKYGVYFIV